MKLESIQQDAISRLRPRQQYARRVILGEQRWSGGDLRGSSKQWASYWRQRLEAREAFLAAGGELVALKGGAIVGAVTVGVDDYGNVVFETTDGAAILRAADRAVLAREA